jgi:hypothetical protein
LEVEAFALNTSGSGLGSEIERVCVENELVISTWSPIHLRTKLQELYWKPDRTSIGALAFWEDTLRYLYLPRLRNREVLAQAITKGTGSRDFFGTAYGYNNGKFDGFKLGDANVQLDDTLLLIEPETAKAYEEASRMKPVNPAGIAGARTTEEPGPSVSNHLGDTTQGTNPLAQVQPASPKAKSFHGMTEIPAATAKMRLVQVAEEIIAVLAADPNAEVKVALEIQVNFPAGASDQTKRAVTENAKTLNFKNVDWE